MSNQDNHSDSDTPQTPVIIYTNAARFSLGHIVATPGALRLLEKTGFSAAALISRHVHGDWGDICKEDADQNDFSIGMEQRILSVYRLVDGERSAATPAEHRHSLPTVWIITESDRSVTTLLFPSDY